MSVCDLSYYDDDFNIGDFEEELVTSAAAATAAITFYGIHEARERRNHRLHLCRKELCPNPRAGTPWQHLWASQEDCAFTKLRIYGDICIMSTVTYVTAELPF